MNTYCNHNPRLSTAMRFVTLAVAALLAIPSYGWSKKGHQITAYIAQRHMTSTTYNEINKLLDGDNIVYWASWLDQARNQQQYAHTKTWHYLNVDADETYETRYHNPNGDVVTAVEYAYDVLTDNTSSKSDRQFALKVVIHVIADAHQPMHVGHGTDSGGNGIKLTYEGSSTNLHSLWDYDVVENTHSWSYYDWQQNIDVLSKAENDRLAEGDIEDWVRQNIRIAADIYKAFPRNSDVTGGKLDQWGDTVETLMLSGGLRLAKWLNIVFDENYSDAPIIEADDDTQLVDVYSISGVCLRSQVPVTEATDGMPSGLYIVNRTKVLVK
ncbi:MAG: S1/P1 nuclease [Muribaculaceae bacterium]|nr:S1/P1 nuclease [Muribaculaceae bacterium]